MLTRRKTLSKQSSLASHLNLEELEYIFGEKRRRKRTKEWRWGRERGGRKVGWGEKGVIDKQHVTEGR